MQKSVSINSFFYLINNLCNVVFPFISSIYVTRVLLPNDIGSVTYAQNIAQYFVTFSFLGIPTYGLREISKCRDNQDRLNKTYSELFYINLISTSFFLFAYLCLIFSFSFFKNNIKLYLVFGVLIACNAINNSWLFEGLEEFKYISLRNILVKITCFLLLFFLVKDSKDTLMYAIITIAGTIISYFCNIKYSTRYVHLEYKNLNLKRHLKSTLILASVNFSVEIYALFGTTLLGYYKSNDAVAFFSYGNKVYSILISMIGVLTVVVVPRLSNLYYLERKNEFNILLSKTVRFIFIISIPCIIGIIFLSDLFFSIVYGTYYIRSSMVLKIMSIRLIIYPIWYLLGSRVLLIAGNEKGMWLSVTAGVIVNLLVNNLLIPAFGEFGAAFSSVVCDLVIGVMYLLQSKKLFKLKFIMKTLAKVLMSSVVMSMLLFFLCWAFEPASFISLLLTVFFCGLTYFCFLILFKEDLVIQNINLVVRRLLR